MSWYSDFKTGTKDHLVSGKSKKSKSYSSYGKSSWWMDDWDYDYHSPVYSSYSPKEIATKNLYKLAAHRRAIANFVSIVTGQSIPVKFSTKGDSYTDGKVVTISANIAEPKEFDPAVGLALHEGSHIKLSNFQLLRDLDVAIHKIVGSEEFGRLSELSKQKGIHYMPGVIKDILNYVEDRRIDNYIYKSAPGYRDYYRSMYDKFFNDPAIDKGMKSDEFTEETFEAYMFRLINLHSKFSRPNALKRLVDIARVIKLNEISRLRTTEDALKIAIEVYSIMVEAIEPLSQPQNGQGQGQGNGNGQAGEGEQEAGEDDIDVQIDDSDGDGNDESGDTDGNADICGDSNEPAEDGKGIKGKISVKVGKNGKATNQPADGRLSQRQMDIIRKKIEKQKEFLRGNIKKSKMTQSEAKQLESIEEAGAEMKVVAQDYYGVGSSFKGIECIVVKKMTRSLMESQDFPLTSKRWAGDKDDTMYLQHANEVAEGIRLGTLLGKKLQVRGESRETIFNRQLVGKMDKRMVSSLGYGNEHVFFTKEIDMFKKANLHISVDASGSMSGSKWNKTMINIVALAKAVDMIANLNIQISFRTTSQSGLPYIVLAYDSRVDKFMKVKQLFGYLHAGGTTPEGLCFEAIMKQMVGSNTEMDSYFLNISDGEPYFSAKGMSYSGSNAAKHTRKMVKAIEGMGIKVMSYFVADNGHDMDENSSSSARIFKECYGPAASYINVTNINEVTRTMNRLFMSKPQNS
jgi:hypothetical protein